MRIRSWNVPRRRRVRDVAGYDVVLEERREYAPVREALRRSKELVDKLQACGRENAVGGEKCTARLKAIRKACGQEFREP